MPLIILIRLAPFPPMVYNNALFAVRAILFEFLPVYHGLSMAPLLVHRTRRAVAIHLGHFVHDAKIIHLHFCFIASCCVFGRKATSGDGRK